jgi:hypothetical protein
MSAEKCDERKDQKNRLFSFGKNKKEICHNNDGIIEQQYQPRPISLKWKVFGGFLSNELEGYGNETSSEFDLGKGQLLFLYF